MGAICSAGKEENGLEARYSVAGQLGKGSQGTVFACVDRATGRECAVKVLDTSKASAWNTFRREVDLCAEAAGCPYVVEVLEHFSGYSSYSVVMPRYETHLRAALKASALSPGSGFALEDAPLRRIIAQALSALVHLHSHEIVHRDVKAQNFLTDRADVRDEKCNIILSDFGLARKLPIGQHLSAAVGTRKYWAPDVYKKKYSHNVDIFAVGVLIFLAASGTYPYQSEEQTRTLDVFEAGTVPTALTQDARDFMRACLRKDFQERPSSWEMLARPWTSEVRVATGPLAKRRGQDARRGGEADAPHAEVLVKGTNSSDSGGEDTSASELSSSTEASSCTSASEAPRDAEAPPGRLLDMASCAGAVAAPRHGLLRGRGRGS